MKLTALFALLAAGAALAQVGPGPGGPMIPNVGVPPQLHLYLELTQQQIATIVRENGALLRFQSEKMRRASDVQNELREEMARPSLDAMAIGLRYVELEAINREIQAERQKTVTEIQKALTPAQKTKLSALADALKASGTACDAINFNVMPMPEIQTPQPGNIVGMISYSPPMCGGGMFPSRVLVMPN